MTEQITEPVDAVASNLPVRADVRHQVARCDVPQTLNEQLILARAIANSGILPKHLRGKPENVLAVMYGARALDLPLWQAMQEMHDVDGKIGISANLMRALWLRAGHSFRVIERTNEKATVEAVRTGEDPYRVTFTIDDARQAGLAGKGNWSKYPKAMLVARATSTCLREIGADILLGFGYTPDELADGGWDDPDLAEQAREEARTTSSRGWDVDIPGLAAEIAGHTTEDDLRDVWRRANALGVLDATHDGITVGDLIRARVDAIKADAEAVDAEVVEDQPQAAEVPAAFCDACGGTGTREDGTCAVCVGTGVQA